MSRRGRCHAGPWPDRLTHTWTCRPSAPPVRRLAERPVDDLLGELADQVRLLGEPDELRRRPAPRGAGAASGRAPPSRSSCRRPAVSSAGSAARSRRAGPRAQVAGSASRRRSCGPPSADVPLDPAVPLLGQVHGDVGALHQLLETVRVVGIDGDPDARLDRNVMPSSRTGSASAARSRDATSRAAAASLTEGSSTANSSPPSRATTSPGRTLCDEPVRHDLQQPVADGVTEGVVDLLETGRPVQVDQQEPGLGAGDVGAGQRLAVSAWRAACG